MPFVTTLSGKLHYQLVGDGPQKVLLIMGMSCDKHYWDPLPRLLSEITEGQLNEEQARDEKAAGNLGFPLSPRRKKPLYQTCTFDTRGFGHSPSGDLSRIFTSATQAEDILALLSHLGWIVPKSQKKELAEVSPPILHIVGWSMGGMIALELASILLGHGNIHHASSLVLVSSSSGGLRWHKSTLTNIRHYLKLSAWVPVPVLRNFPPLSGFFPGWRTILSFSTLQRIRNTLRLHHSTKWLKSCPSQYLCDRLQVEDSEDISPTKKPKKKPTAPKTYSALLLDIYLQRAPFKHFFLSCAVGFLGHFLTAASHNVSDKQLARFQSKSSCLLPLVITGEHDRLVDPRNSFHLAQKMKSDLVCFPETGHMVHLEHPYAMARILDQHFRLASNGGKEQKESTDTLNLPSSTGSMSRLTPEALTFGPSHFIGVPSILGSLLEYTPFFFLLWVLVYYRQSQWNALVERFGKNIGQGAWLLLKWYVVFRFCRDLGESAWKRLLQK